MKKFLQTLLVLSLATLATAQTNYPPVTFVPNSSWTAYLSAVPIVPGATGTEPLQGLVTLQQGPINISFICTSDGILATGVAAISCVVQPFFSGPIIAQEALLDDSNGTQSEAFTFANPTSGFGSTLVVIATGNINGQAPPVPTATGVTFLECAACASTNGDMYVSHTYYALNAPPTTTINLSAIPGPYILAAYELSGVTGLDGGTKLGTSFGNYCTASISYTPKHQNTLQIASMYGMDTANLSGSLNKWTFDGASPFADNTNGTFAHTTQLTTTMGKLVDKFPACIQSRPTMSLVAFF